MESNEVPVPAPDYDELPVRLVTMNQLVAYNLSYWRRRLRMTQEELGTLLEVRTGRPWSKATVSSAERSWDGKRIRQFDADEILALSTVLGVPIAGLFLPPTDDGSSTKYHVHSGSMHFLSEYHDVGGLLSIILPDVADGEDGNLGHYRERLESAIDFHYGEGTFVDLNRYSMEVDSPEQEIEMQRGRIAYQKDALRAILADLERASDQIEAEAAKLLPSDDLDAKPYGTSVAGTLTLFTEYLKTVFEDEKISELERLAEVRIVIENTMEIFDKDDHLLDFSYKLLDRLAQHPEQDQIGMRKILKRAMAKSVNPRTPLIMLMNLIDAEIASTPKQVTPRDKSVSTGEDSDGEHNETP